MKKLALVTGGTRGIGKSISIALKSCGYNVVATYNSNDTCAESFANMHNIKIRKWNVGDFEECNNNVQDIQAEYGMKISALINNAGITRDSMLHKMSYSDWYDVISINLSSCFNMCSAVIKDMRENNFGRIVNITSINGQAGQVGQTNYCAAKAGMIGFTKALALESASKNITVNAIAPGYIETDMTNNMNPEVLQNIANKIPAKRLGKAIEVARCVEFLVSEESSFINGAVINVNGGQYM